MLKKVIIKNFCANIKSYLIFFISEVMATALFFSLFALRECLLAGIQDEMVLYLLDYEFKIASAVMLIVTTLLMFFSMKYYMKSRIKDYSFFLTLGMRKNLLGWMVFAEYAIGWLCSVCVGLAFGKVLVIGCQEILRRVDATYKISYSAGAKTYGITLGVSLFVMAAAVFILMVNLPSVNKGTHGRRRINFCSCRVTFLSRTSSTRQSSALQEQKLILLRPCVPLSTEGRAAGFVKAFP